MSGRGSIGQPHEFVIHERSAPAFAASRVVHRELIVLEILLTIYQLWLQ